MSKTLEEKLLKAEEIAMELYTLVLDLDKEDIKLDWSIINMLESLEEITKNTYQYVSSIKLSTRLTSYNKYMEDKL